MRRHASRPFANRVFRKEALEIDVSLSNQTRLSIEEEDKENGIY